MQLIGISITLLYMTSAMKQIAAKVRGVAAENRLTQEHIAQTLGLSRSSVSQRFSGSVPFTAPELLTLSEKLGVSISAFFPTPSAPSSSGSPQDGEGVPVVEQVSA